MNENKDSESLLTKALRAVELSEDAFKEVPRLSIDKESKIISPPPGYGSVFFITESPIMEITYEETKKEEPEEEQ